MATLYEITGKFQELLQMAEDGDVSQQALEDTLESLEYDLEQKAIGYAKVIKELEGQAAVINAEKQRLEEREKVLNSNIKKLKTTLKQAFESAGMQKLKTDLFSFNIQRAGVRALSIDGEVPPEYLKKPEPDNAAIKELLKTTEVPWAHLKEATEYLVIR